MLGYVLLGLVLVSSVSAQAIDDCSANSKDCTTCISTKNATCYYCGTDKTCKVFDQGTIFSVKTCGGLKYNVGICQLNVMVIAILISICIVLVLISCCCLCCCVWCACRRRSKRAVNEEEMKFLDSKAEIRERSADRQVAHY
ncbi:hypothetical protein EMCRGX_G013044 [Ephydatia muelleri]